MNTNTTIRFIKVTQFVQGNGRWQADRNETTLQLEVLIPNGAEIKLEAGSWVNLSAMVLDLEFKCLIDRELVDAIYNTYNKVNKQI